MINLPPAQSADRITALLIAHESRTLDFKRISGKQGRMYEAVCAFANTDSDKPPALKITVGHQINPCNPVFMAIK